MLNAVEVRDVTMQFRMSKDKVDSIKEYFIRKLKRQMTYDEFYALHNVTVDIPAGDVFGIIGLNGSGKSTLLKVISGILKPTRGRVATKGTISPLIELGAGFDFELTARENVFLNGLVLGYSRRQMQEKFDEIIEFSELQEFVNVPLKNYSSGMIARLGFAIATITKPDILIVDEILSVGDFLFQKKCEERIQSLMAGNTTVIIVSHSIEQIERLCRHVMWLEKGVVRAIGETQPICAEYKQLQ